MAVYDELKAKVLALRAERRLSAALTRDQRISWAYGNAVVENPAVTVQMVEQAVDKLPSK